MKYDDHKISLICMLEHFNITGAISIGTCLVGLCYLLIFCPNVEKNLFEVTILSKTISKTVTEATNLLELQSLNDYRHYFVQVLTSETGGINDNG